MSFRSCLSLACWILLSACRQAEKPADLVVVNGKEPESLDPAVFTGQSDSRIGLALFEGLTRYDHQTAAATPGLADSWEISGDGRVYSFHIRPDAKWSTGSPITAEDFEYSWRRVLDPKTACDYAGIMFCVRNAEAFCLGKMTNGADLGFRATDRRTFRVELTQPTPFFLEVCAYPTLAAVPRRAIEQHGDRWILAKPMPSSGAYALDFWRLNDRVRLLRNPHYWDHANTKSAVVDLLSVANPVTALNLYETAAADIIWDKDLIPSDLLAALRSRPDFHVFDYLATYFLRFNTTKSPFDLPQVRLALALAIDKDAIVKRITKGGERPADHLVPPGMPSYESPHASRFQPELARQLLAKAGFPDGRGFPRFQYLIDNHREHQKIAVEIQAGWERELGIRAELRALEWKAFLPAQARLDYDVCRSSWVGDYSDPTTFLDLFMGTNPNNRTGWRNARYDELLRAAHAEPDVKRRAERLRLAEHLLVCEEAPIAPLYFYAGFNFWRPEQIQGVVNNARDEHPLRMIGRKTTQANRPGLNRSVIDQPQRRRLWNGGRG